MSRLLPTLCLVLALWPGLPPWSLGAPPTTAELVRVLASDAPVQDKALACRQLGELGTGEAVPALAALLDHEILAAYARTALERIPDPGAPAALRSALETTEGDLLIGVITSLGSLRDEDAVEALTRLSRDEDAPISGAALRALGRIATPPAVGVVQAALSSGREDAASATLLAAEEQRAHGHEDVAIALYDAVRSADVPRPCRLGATRGAIVSRRSVPFLLEQLGSDDRAIRDVALGAIREMPSSGLADALHARLASAGPDLRLQLTLALRDCHNEASFAVVRAELADDSEAVRLAALTVVSAVGQGPELATALLDVVAAGRSPAEKQAAMELLTRMEGGAEVDRVILGRLAADETVDARIDVIRVLGDRRVQDAVDDLLAQARDPNPRVRVAALRAMRRMVGPREVAPLVAVLKSESEGPARMDAIRALVSACGDDGASGARMLVELTQSSNASDRDAWTRVLTAVGYPGALPVLLERLGDEDPEVVADTVGHLSRWPDPAPIEALLALMGDVANPEVRRRAVSAVLQLVANAADRGQRPDGVLVGWLERAGAAAETVTEKRLLLSGLARVHTLGSLLLLEPYLADPDVETEAGYALLSIGSALVKAGQSAPVRRVMAAAPTVKDEELAWRLQTVKEQADAASSPSR
jgi:HEAT repeat protein